MWSTSLCITPHSNTLIKHVSVVVKASSQRISYCVLHMWKANSGQSTNPIARTSSRIHVWKLIHWSKYTSATRCFSLTNSFWAFICRSISSGLLNCFPRPLWFFFPATRSSELSMDNQQCDNIEHTHKSEQLFPGQLGVTIWGQTQTFSNESIQSHLSNN